jgi:Flp pilus assembly protein TadB
MEPNPPRPVFQLLAVLLIAVEIGALVWGDDLLMVAVLAVIVVVAVFWWRDSRARRVKREYEPAKSEPREDWGGKRGSDGEPL